MKIQDTLKAEDKFLFSLNRDRTELSIIGPVTTPSGWHAVIWRGLRGKCPQCGKSGIFSGYLQVKHHCDVCDAPLGDMPADDTPIYIAMVIVVHIMAVFITLFFYFHYIPGFFASAMWLCLLTVTCCIVLRIVKGAVIGVLLKLDLWRGNRELELPPSAEWPE
ncbi:MAG: DUF983 domain-containing protein [Rhodospirillales bacterium]|nr:DUF983 domain-containing protein [Rhodospirillales bacterium]